MSTSSTLKGRTVFIYFALFFGIIIVVDAGMMTAALRTHTGLVTTRPYEKGLAYNQVVEAANAQAELGWKATIHFEKSVVYYELKDAQGSTLHPDSVIAEFTRPTQSGMDFSLAMNKTEDGLGYSLQPDFPARGLWEVRIFAQAQGHKFQQSKRIVVE